MLVALATVAVNCLVANGTSAAVVGLRVTDTAKGAVTVTVAESDREGKGELVAVTV